MLNVTRDVVADLWPVYEAGEATADTRALVDEFLKTDPEFAATLRAAAGAGPPQVDFQPETKLAALKRTRDLVRGNGWLRGLRLFAIVMTIFSFVRIITDTSWDVSPRRFIAEAVLAVISWTAYAVFINRYRRKSLRA
jgi:hypothetical protein